MAMSDKAKTYDVKSVSVAYDGREVTGFNVPFDNVALGDDVAPKPLPPRSRPMNRHERRSAAALARKGCDQ